MSHFNSKREKGSRAKINRANAQYSTGPRTPEGKAASRFNALTHGLCAQTLILPEADQDSFTNFSRNLANDLHVHGTLEESLAMNMAAAQYQIERARAIGNNILEIGAIDHAAELPESEQNPSIRHAIGLAESYKANAKSLDLISRYTARHSREFLHNHTRLCQVQKERQRYQQERKQRHSQAFGQYQQAAVAGKQASSNDEHAEASGFVPQPPSSAPDDVHLPLTDSPITGANTLGLVKTNEENAA